MGCGGIFFYNYDEFGYFTGVTEYFDDGASITYDRTMFLDYQQSYFVADRG